MTTISSTSSALALSSQVPSPKEQLHKAAQQFEAIFVRQMLSTARASNFGNDLLSSQGMDTFNAMQDERFAEIASQSGALGFAKIIEAQLAKRIDPSANGKG